MVEWNRASSDEGECVGPKSFEKMFANLQRVDGPAPEVMAEIKSLVKELAEQDYPEVWVGQEGMTATRLLDLQELNEGLPEWMRLEPGEMIQAEGTEGGIQMPEVGGVRLNGYDVVLYLKDEMDPDEFGELWDEVVRIQLAKQGRVLLTVFPSAENLPDVMRIPIPVDGIPASEAEDLIQELDFYTTGGRGCDYVIPETERVKAFLAEHGEYFG